ncbi:hypothetical protein [Vitiosangium sp. GDMCC 1.1324]|uniref:hypothetical protein n=1 Tax=Vitiosangium sp. (strain GDMCC 1.1324) TaxID=2138576 RepID=UPI00130EC2A8|nr:hypothetical protein [Vitiosangium sp. GDMCC 1.1324]
MAARLRMGVLLMLGGVLMGVGLERFLREDDRPERGRPVGWPREEVDAPEALDEGWAEEAEVAGDAARTWEGVSWDDEDEVLWKEGSLVWGPKLRLWGPWRDGRRSFAGGVKFLEEMPHGLYEPGIFWLWMDLHKQSHMGRGDAWAILERPRMLKDRLKFENNYFNRPEIDLYGPRDEEKGNKPVSFKSSNPPTAEVSVKMKLLTLCIGLSASACAAVQVRQVDTEWLEDCPKEARVAIEALGLGTGEPYDVEVQLEPGRRNETPAFMKEGPLVAHWEGLHLGPDFSRSDVGRRMKGSKLYGRGKVYGNRMSIHFNRLVLADGRELPVCAVGYDVWGKEPGLERWGPGSHKGVGVLNDDPRRLAALQDLRPGEFPTPGPTIWISFGSLFKREWLTRR